VAGDLLDNALKHTRAGAVSRCVPCRISGNGGCGHGPVKNGAGSIAAPNSVEVSVTDSGPGIAAEHHQEIFEDFCGWTGHLWMGWDWPSPALIRRIAESLVEASRDGSRFTFYCRWIRAEAREFLD